VHKGRWKGTEVAVKTISAEHITRDMRKSFQEETAIMSRLRHPNTVLFMAASTKPPLMCIVMEYMALGSLYDVRSPSPTLAPAPCWLLSFSFSFSSFSSSFSFSFSLTTVHSCCTTSW
jgi:serine/threonine protein kinase